MAEKVTIELPDELAERVRTVAAETRRSFDAVVVDWIRQAGFAPMLEQLPDEELLTICDQEPPASQQEELADLLDQNREGVLQAEQRERLEVLMRAYRASLLQKAQALQVAVRRGIRPRLN